MYETKKADNLVINLHLNTQLSIIAIVAIFERLLEKRANCEFINKGDCYTLDNSLFIKLIEENAPFFIDSEAYVYNVLKKYYGPSENEYRKL